MQHELLGNCQEYQEETYKQLLDRYNGFGKDIYLKIKIQFPTIFENIKFYQAVKDNENCVGNYPYSENSYAIFDDGTKSFSIEIDPESEQISIFNYDIMIETGYWSNDFYTEALNFIGENFC